VTDNAGLQSLLHIGGLSNMGLCDLLKAIRKLPSLPEASRHQINEVHAARFTTVRHVEPMPLVDSDGETYAWELCEPNLMLASVLGECPRLAEVYLNAPEDQANALVACAGVGRVCPRRQVEVQQQTQDDGAVLYFLGIGPARVVR
jgi:hypothetical protein